MTDRREFLTAVGLAGLAGTALPTSAAQSDAADQLFLSNELALESEHDLPGEAQGESLPGAGLTRFCYCTTMNRQRTSYTRSM